MADIEKVISGLSTCANTTPGCEPCPYRKLPEEQDCATALMKDALELLKEHKEERKRMLSWLSKFCRHIDNGDKWLTDEENLEFFREKMKQQFGWFAD